MHDKNNVSNGSCANCGVTLTDRFCAHCGQDSHVTMSVRHFIDEFLEGVFHFDSTFWRTFFPLLFKPGVITERYLAGQRKAYAPPLRSYLVISLVYFALASLFAGDTVVVRKSDGSNVVAITDASQIDPKSCTDIATSVQWLHRFVDDVGASCRRAFGDGGHAFRASLQSLFPKVMFAVLPLVALVQFWMFGRTRRLYVENLIFVLHFQSFYYLANSLLLVGAAALRALVHAFGGTLARADKMVDAPLLIWAAVYLFLGMRRVYGASRLKSFSGMALLAIAYMVFWMVGTSIAALYAFLHA